MSRQPVAVGIVISCLVALIAVGQIRDKRQPARRAELPTFDRALMSQIFFDDVFTKLHGPRPASPTVLPMPLASGKEPTPGDPTTTHAWGQVISRATIEREVKAIKIRLDQSVTTPTNFAGRGFRTARRDFSILAVLFAIISEYDGDVRWKNDAAAARDAFARVASIAKASGNANVYQEARSRLEDLGSLLRGSGVSARPVQPAENPWENLTARAPLMQRLDRGSKQLAVWTANSAEFSRNSEQVVHEAEMIASLSEVLVKEGMEDGDDEDYAAFVRRMQKSAQDISAAVQLNSVDQARRAFGELNQTCDACHELYQ